jgi:hypothetical protein
MNSGGLRVVAMHNAPPAYARALAQREQREPIYRPGRLSELARVIATKRTVRVSDYSRHAAFKEREPGPVRLGELGGARITRTAVAFEAGRDGFSLESDGVGHATRLQRLSPKMAQSSGD